MLEPEGTVGAPICGCKVVTTGTFTREARLEARRDGATPIDLIDGQEIVEKLKGFGIGVSVKQKIIKEVMIDQNFFQTL